MNYQIRHWYWYHCVPNLPYNVLGEKKNSMEANRIADSRSCTELLWSNIFFLTNPPAFVYVAAVSIMSEWKAC